MAKQQQEQLPTQTTFEKLEPGEWFQACGEPWMKDDQEHGRHPTDPSKDQWFFPQAKVSRMERPEQIKDRRPRQIMPQQLPELNTDGGDAGDTK